MTWILKNSSNDPGEMAWVVSPTSGIIEPFGETVVEVVAQTTGLNARERAYKAFFDIYSGDVCVCRDQTIEMALELVVTAEVSAANSYLQVLDATTIEAAGQLVFRIIPVRLALLSCMAHLYSASFQCAAPCCRSLHAPRFTDNLGVPRLMARTW